VNGHTFVLVSLPLLPPPRPSLAQDSFRRFFPSYSRLSFVVCWLTFQGTTFLVLDFPVLGHIATHYTAIIIIITTRLFLWIFMACIFRRFIIKLIAKCLPIYACSYGYWMIRHAVSRVQGATPITTFHIAMLCILIQFIEVKCTFFILIELFEHFIPHVSILTHYSMCTHQ